jgi:hypothetical protein
VYDVSDNDNQSKEQKLGSKILHPILVLPIHATIPIIVKWHPKINQIFIGCSNGQTMILYDAQYHSTKGILVPLSKKSTGTGYRVDDAVTELIRSRIQEGGNVHADEIITPNYRDDDATNNAKRKKRKDEWKYP